MSKKTKTQSPDRSPLGRFVPGVSGNPSGRNQLTQQYRELRKQLLSGVPKVIEQIRRQAIKGDMVAAGLVLRYGMPPQKPQSPTFDLRSVTEAETPLDKAKEALRLVEVGEIPIEIGTTLAQSYAQMHRDQVITDIQARLDALEQN